MRKLTDRAALAAAQGLPDIGLAPLTDFTRVIKEMTTVTTLPVLADADTGFGSLQMVERAVYEYNAAGAAGLHIEDQKSPKRCGHLQGKTLVTIDKMVEKIRVAVEAARKVSNNDFIICARTDAFSVEGLEGAFERATQYVKAGADMIFPEGLSSQKMFSIFAESTRRLAGSAPEGGPYLLANLTEFGETPVMGKEALEATGFHCAIYPVSALRVSLKAMDDMYADLQNCGTLERQLPSMFTRQQLYETLRYNPSKEWVFPSVTTGRNSR
ncbi:hypothetical protein Efla_005706 [Eimeria flavescens]